MSKKKKVYIGLIVIIIVVALAILFSGKVASQKNLDGGIPDNMAISNELGG